MKKYTNNELWAFVNRIEVESATETRKRAQQAIKVLDKCDYLDMGIYDDMMETIACVVRESYHR